MRRAAPAAAGPASGGAGVRLVLASASPRRRALLAQVGVVPDAVLAPDVDERPFRAERPRAYAARIARLKADAVEAGETACVLAADTVVAVGRRILDKPEDAAAAERALRLLSGRRHRVITAVLARRGERRLARLVETAVRFKRLSETEIAAYIASREWEGKAGGYAIQGRAAALIPWIGGSYTNVVGLPLTETLGLLAALGYPVHRPPPGG